MSTDPKGRAWIEVDAPALTRNLRRIRESVGPGPGLLPMVKADAYGVGVHGAVAALAEADPWGFGVATAAEGARIRDLGWTGPIFVASPLPPAELDGAVESRLQVGVSDVATLEALARLAGAGAEPAFHVEVDTGMGRAGFDWRHADEWGGAVRDAARAGARWAGTYTHLRSADAGAASVHLQWRRLREALEALRPPPEARVHLLNSAGTLRCPEYGGDLVRPGIFLYGGRAGADLPLPDPVASLRARVVHAREAEEGDTVGYGATHVASRGERWATVALGYGDGYPRALSNGGRALVRGTEVPVVGRISMDVTVVDVTGAPSVDPGDVVTFIGRDGARAITVDEVADQAGTIAYEVLTGFTARLPRVWQEGPVGR